MNRHKSRIFLSLPILGLFLVLLECNGFSPSMTTAVPAKTKSVLLSKNSDDETPDQRQSESTDDESDKGEFNWLEEWALEGKDAVALMKVRITLAITTRHVFIHFDSTFLNSKYLLLRF